MNSCCSVDRLILAALLLLVSTPGMRGQETAKLAERLHAADAGSALDAANVKPWHLKMTVQIYNGKGKPTDQGTIEEWWNSPEIDRRDYKTAAYTATEIRNAGKLYRTKDATSPPYYLELLREQTVHPMPDTREVDQSTPELRKVSFGKIALECVMLSQPIKSSGVLPLGLFPTYCFNPGLNVLRASSEFGQQTVLRNRLENFQGRTVAITVSVLSEQTQVASSEVVKLEGIIPQESDFAATEDGVEQSLGPVLVSSGVAAGNIITRPDPVYPESAKQRHVTGTVVMHAIIGMDGHIHSLKLVSATEPDLAISAIAAVRRWTYKPYILQGLPTDVETTINVKYAMGP